MIELPVLKVPDEFYKEEERNGFLVTCKRKQVWAVELDLYIKLESVCRKYGLSLYSDAGTLLLYKIHPAPLILVILSFLPTFS